MPAPQPDPQPCARCGHALPPGFHGNTCPACLLLAGQSGSKIATGETHTIPIGSGSSISPVRPGGNAPPQHDLEVIGPYHLLEQLGEGGFGVVYRALQQEPIRREVALKLIKPGMGSREVLARFEAERRALALMEHPNIAAVLDAGTAENGQPYFVMELVRGQPITTYCDNKRLNLRQRLELFIPVCQAVQHAHQKAVLHRDLKPSNILVAEVDDLPLVKVIDFGVAKALGQDGEESWLGTLSRTLEGMVVGTPLYMSPEQAGAAPDLDTRSDVYTLGVILYELLCGETPLTRESLRQAAVDEMLLRIREEEAARPSSKLTPVSEAVRARAETRQAAPERLSRELKGDLDWITLRALEKDRERRYGSAAALAADIRRHLACEPVEAGPPSTFYLFQKFVRRKHLSFSSVLSMALLLAARGILNLWEDLLGRRAMKQSAIVTQERQEITTKLGQASREDYKMALRKLDQDGNWKEGILLLARALEWQPENTLAAARLYDSLIWLSCQGMDIPREKFEQKGHCREAVFSPDGSCFATIYWDGTAQIWDVKTGRAKGGPFRGEGGFAQFSPDGALIVTATDDKTAQVWNAKTGVPLGKSLPHEEGVWAAQFSSDGTKVVTAGGHDKKAQIWDAKTGVPFGPPLRHGGCVCSAQFSPDGTKVATASWDKSVRIWNIAPERLFEDRFELAMMKRVEHEHEAMMKRVEHEDERRFDELKQLMLIAKLKEELSKNPQNFPKPLPFSPSQETSTASPDKDCTPQSYSPPISSQSLLENKKPEFKYQEIEHQDKVLGAEFSPDGSQILTYGGQTAQIWDSNTCKLIGQPIHHDQDIQSARFSPDGAQILIYSGQTAQVWDKATFKRIGSPLSHDGKIRSAEFSPDGARIVTTSEDGTAKVWDAKTAQALGMPMHHADSAWESPKVIKACFSLDGSHIFTISSDFSDWSLWKWESATDKTLAEPLRHGRKVWHAEFSPDGSRILTCSDEIVQLWDAETLHAFSEPMPMLHQTGVRTVQFSPDGNCIVTGADDTAKLWDVKTGQAKGGSLRHAGEVEHARFSLDGTRVAIQTREGQVQVWHVQTGARLAHIFAPDGKSLYGTPVFSPNGHYILTRSFFIVRLWDAETGQIIGEPMDHQNRVYSAEFNADGSRIITHTHDTAQVWDAMTGKRVGPSATSPGNGVRFNAKRTQFIGFFDNVVGINDATKDDLPQILAEMQPMMHRERVASAQFSLDGSRIITTCEDDTAQVWDATNGDPLGGPIRLKHRIESINSNPDGSRLLTTSRDGAAMLWRLPALTKFRQQVPDWIPAFACAACGLRFDPDGEIKAIPAKERLKVLRQPRPDLDAWAKLARWIATPNSERTLTPESHFTCRQIAERERDAVPPNRQALESAIRYDPSVPLAHLLLAEFLEAKENMPNITDIGRARHLREYGLKLLADNNDELCLRAAESLFRQKDYAKCRAAAKKVGLSASDTLRQAAMQIQTKSELMMMRPRLLWASRDANSGEV